LEKLNKLSYFCISDDPNQNQNINMKLMTKKNLLATAFFVVSSSLIVSCDNSSNDPQSGYSDKIESVTLLKTTKSWDGTTYPAYPATQPEISVLKIAVPPNSALSWHKHPIINAAYVEKVKFRLKEKRMVKHSGSERVRYFLKWLIPATEVKPEIREQH